MNNKIIKNTALFICFLVLFTTSAYSEDNCSGRANSIPPLENNALTLPYLLVI